MLFVRIPLIRPLLAHMHISTHSTCRRMCAPHRGTRGNTILTLTPTTQGGGILQNSHNIMANISMCHQLSSHSSRDLVLLILPVFIVSIRLGCPSFQSIRHCLHVHLHMHLLPNYTVSSRALASDVVNVSDASEATGIVRYSYYTCLISRAICSSRF